MDSGHIAVRFAEAVARYGERPATSIRSGSGWATRSFTEMGTDVRRLAARLVELGLAPGDRVAIFAPNRPEWSVADLACLSAGLVTVPLYPTSTPEQLRHIVADSGSRAIFLAGAAEWGVLAQVLPELPGLERVITFESVDDALASSLAAELAAAPSDTSGVDDRLEAATADDLATIIYTSGTTGEPKGAMLAHRGFTFQIDLLSRYFSFSADDSSLCFLPLSHALERAWTYVVLSNGCLNTYVPDPRTVAELMVAAQPSLLVSVPRLYEKVFTTAREKVADSALKQRLMAWALSVGTTHHTAVIAGRPISGWLKLRHKVADRLVLGAIRHAVGGDKTVLACGGAPLRKEVEEFFFSCGLLVLQGYGLTESSPLISFPSAQGFRFGTVGRVVDGGEVRIAEGGEICYRGPNVMQGYWGKPADTAAALVDGWLHTGDVGEIDSDGFLRITDRIKDLIVTSNGKKIAPAPIEGMLAADPLLEHTLLLGDNRPYLTLLVAPSLPHLEDIAARLQLTWNHRDELLTNPEILQEVRRRVAELTAKLAKHEQIQDLRLMIGGVSQENGLLTPTLKVKRREVERRFAHLVEEMYARASKGRRG